MATCGYNSLLPPADMEEVRHRLQWLHICAGAQGELASTNQMINFHTTEAIALPGGWGGWPWGGEWPWPSAAPLCPMSPCRPWAPDGWKPEWMKWTFLNTTTRGNLMFLRPTLMWSAFLPQAFLGDLFSKHQKEVSSEKLEEYTDTMVGTPALIAGPSQT